MRGMKKGSKTSNVKGKNWDPAKRLAKAKREQPYSDRTVYEIAMDDRKLKPKDISEKYGIGIGIARRMRRVGGKQPLYCMYVCAKYGPAKMTDEEFIKFISAMLFKTVRVVKKKVGDKVVKKYYSYNWNKIDKPNFPY